MSQPCITVGMVVRNGALHLAEAVDSFLNQTRGDFELVIYDNASTDATPQIAARMAAMDRRVRVVRHDRNLGALGNLIHAAEHASTPFFCWAAHDDLRMPEFLATLTNLLEADPDSGLACCAVRNMDPDGSLRELRPETASLRTTTGMTRAQRLRMYLKESPGTPFYGVFRTDALLESLDVLRRDGLLDGVPLLGLDMAFLADIVRRHGLAVTSEPLLMFRRGGWSHRIDVYGSLGTYLRHIAGFAAALRRASSDESSSPAERIRLHLARVRYVLAYLMSAPMRRMSWHYLSSAMPGVKSIESWMACRADHALVRLRRRIRGLPRGSRIVIFGAGKHTRRRIRAIRSAIGRRCALVAIADDRPAAASLAGIGVIASQDLRSLRPDVVLVSSDTYEAQLFARAREATAAESRVWCLYDTAIECGAADRSSDSTSPMNAFRRSIPSSPSMAAAPSGRRESTNAIR